MIFGLVGASVLARQLGVEQYGLFQYALSLIVIFTSLGYMCGSEILIPALVKADKKNQKEIIGNAFIIRLFFSFIAYFSLLLFAALTEKIDQVCLVALLGISIFFAESFAVISAWLQSQTNSKPRSILLIVVALFKACFMLALYLTKQTSPFLYAIPWVLDIVLLAIGLCFIYLKLNNDWFFTYSFSIAYELFKKGLPFFSGLIVMSIFMRLDMVMARKILDSYSFGHYAAATQLLNNILALSPILIISMAPNMVYKIDNIRNAKKNIIKICSILVIVSLVSALIIQLLSPYIVPVLLGEQYNKVTPILSALAWSSCFFFLNEGLNLYLIKIERGDLVTIKWLITLLLSIPTYYYLTLNYHVYGVVIAYACSYAIICLIGVLMLLVPNKEKTNY